MAAVALLNAKGYWEVFEDQYVFKVNLQGAQISELKTEIKGENLIISKESRKNHNTEKSVAIKFILPNGTNPNGYNTRMEDGIFTVTFSKIEHQSRRRGQFMSNIWKYLCGIVELASLGYCAYQQLDDGDGQDDKKNR